MADSLERRLQHELRQAADGPFVAPDAAGVRSRLRRRRRNAATVVAVLAAIAVGASAALAQVQGGAHQDPDQRLAAAGPSASLATTSPAPTAMPTTRGGSATTTTRLGSSTPEPRVLAEGSIGSPLGPRPWALFLTADTAEFVTLTIDGQPCGYQFDGVADDAAVRGTTNAPAVRELRVGCRSSDFVLVVGVLAPDVTALVIVTDQGAFEAPATADQKYPDGFRYAALSIPDVQGVATADVRRAGPTTEPAGTLVLG